MVKRALLVLLGKLVLIVGSFVGMAYWFKTAPPPSISANERLLNQMLALVTAGSFSAVVALINHSNFWRTLRTALIVIVGVSVGNLSSGSHSPTTNLTAEIFGALIGLLLSQLGWRQAGERPAEEIRQNDGGAK